ncbi:prokaryotic transglycosylase active site [Lucifera butyrica]|uniref:Prokaryotic transglycosylase active site n=1 Tax=Lucifera butyrica TaxID=1351585 RepID=A0A498RAT2_9FIRM|nr:lytic transglycosylase domain-containing protein [Lucifera butyrica]VBB08095.1 prokaryotic transglycosylase active site [Lucifera butyrica]
MNGMNGMNGMTEVLNRISRIEQRFTRPAASSGAFSAVMANAQQKIADPGTGAAGSGQDKDTVTRMLYAAANKYGVDPQLALAVAQTESGLSPAAQSTAGAVGIMQLMPATAQSLGVNDIYDSRENIDGGVRYLKQMLTNFNGNVAHAVAAYNAGPQAVKDYNGVPPYPETRAYVAKVLSLYQ